MVQNPRSAFILVIKMKWLYIHKNNFFFFFEDTPGDIQG